MEIIIYSLILFLLLFFTIYTDSKLNQTQIAWKNGLFLLFLSFFVSVFLTWITYHEIWPVPNRSLSVLSFVIVDGLYLWWSCRHIRHYFLIFVKILTIFSFCELFLFNFRHYQSLSYQKINDFKIKALKDTEQLETMQFLLRRDTQKPKNGVYEFSFEIQNIDQVVHNVYFNAFLERNVNSKLKIMISASDEANAHYFDLPSRTIVPRVDETKYMPLYLSGKTKALRFTIFIPAEKMAKETILTVSDLRLNTEVPMHIYLFRPLVCALFVLCLYLIRPKSELWKQVLSFSSETQKRLLFLIVAGEIIFLTCTVFSNGVWLNNKSESAQVEYHKLAIALRKGHFYLDDVPSPILKQMDNPYDITARREAFKNSQEYYLWDHAYYEGKYYVYFGIVPCLIAYLPASILLGDFVLPNFLYIYAMGIILCIVSFLLLKEVVKRWFLKTPTMLFILLYLLFINGCCLPYMMHRAEFYSIPIITALMFSVLGLYLWISSTRTVKLQKGRMVLGSLCMALVAGCRPQFIFGSFFVFPIFYEHWKKKEILSKKGWKNTVLFALPYIIVAAFLMYYNYARFGSVFDFGANYNLTTNDMTQRGFELARIPLGLYTYLFEPLRFTIHFPFFESTVIDTNYLGRTISEKFLGGAVMTNLLLLFGLLTPYFKRFFDNKKLYYTALMGMIFSFITIVLDTEMAGVLPRYQADFSWLLLISTILIILSIYSKIKEKNLKQILKLVVSCGVVLLLVYSFLLVFVDITYSLCNTGPYLFYKMARIFMFWM